MAPRPAASQSHSCHCWAHQARRHSPSGTPAIRAKPSMRMKAGASSERGSIGSRRESRRSIRMRSTTCGRAMDFSRRPSVKRRIISPFGSLQAGDSRKAPRRELSQLFFYAADQGAQSFARCDPSSLNNPRSGILDELFVFSAGCEFLYFDHTSVTPDPNRILGTTVPRRDRYTNPTPFDLVTIEPFLDKALRDRLTQHSSLANIDPAISRGRQRTLGRPINASARSRMSLRTSSLLIFRPPGRSISQTS